MNYHSRNYQDRYKQLVRLFLFLFVSGCALGVSAEPFETIQSNGDPANRVDIAIVGDGYTAAEIGKYKTDVQAFLKGFFAEEPFKEYQKYFNVYRVDVISSQSGADHPERSPALFVNTAFDATYNCANIQRLICVDTTKVNAALSRSLAPSQYDVKIVIVNDSEYGGSGGSVAVASTNSAVVELVLHETGHSFGLLADEYGGPPPPTCNNSFEPSEANAAKQIDRALIKWAAWISPSTPIPTTSTAPAVPGAYQGAAYCDAGLYRPTFNSKMRSLGVPYEQINVEQITKRIYNLVSPLDSYSPASASLTLAQGQVQNFGVTTPQPLTHLLNTSWTIDGQQLATGTTFNLDSSSLSVGQHTLTVSISDPTTLVRSDPGHLLSTSHSWTLTVNANSTPGKLQFSAPNFNVNEADGSAIINVTRTGDTSSAVTVDYATSDGTATQRSKYTSANGTLSFAAGQTSQTFTVLITDEAYVEGNQTVNLTLSNPTGSATLDTQSTALLTIIDNDTSAPTTNPADDAQFFVRQQYADFLNRAPDAGGLGYWTSQITNCGSNAQCIHDRRVGVADAFFFEAEFQQTGAYIYRVYKASFGIRPTYAQFTSDRGRVVVGPGLDQSKTAFALAFVQRAAFVGQYPRTLNAAQFVNSLLGSILLNSNADLGAQRDALISLYDGTDNGRAAIIRQVADNQILIDAEYNPSFVLMEYFGYLRRNPDQGGYDFWLGQVNKFPLRNVEIQHAMACSFITSEEYQTRFSSIVTHTNRECPQ
jgi:hypothetical protein